jgi:hypothetical protein
MVDQRVLDDVAEAGQRFYAERLKSLLEPENNGRFVAIDVEAGIYAVADTPLQASDEVQAQGGKALLYLGRVGFSHAVEIH